MTSFVSVIVPLYNKRTTIVRALTSIIKQDVDQLEIIVVDDGSTDGSAELVRDIQDPRIRLICQENAGPGRARNVGASIATAPVLAFLDADDEWEAGYLQAGLSALGRFQECVAYVAGYDTGEYSSSVMNRVATLVTYPQVVAIPKDASAELLLNCLHGMHSSSTIIRNAAFVDAGGFFEAERCLWGEDSFLWIQVLFSGPIYWDPTARIRYHLEDSALGFAVKHRSEPRPICKYFQETMSQVNPPYRRAFQVLVREVAREDAATLSASGFIFSAFKLRLAFSDFRIRGFVGDTARFMRTILKRISATRSTDASIR